MTTRAGMFDDLERMDAQAWASSLAPDFTLPVVTIFRTNGKDLISDYRVYVDAAPVRAEVYN